VDLGLGADDSRSRHRSPSQQASGLSPRTNLQGERERERERQSKKSRGFSEKLGTRVFSEALLGSSGSRGASSVLI